MANRDKKRNIFTRIRNYFIAGVVVLIPLGITAYLTLFLVKISSRILVRCGYRRNCVLDTNLLVKGHGDHRNN